MKYTKMSFKRSWLIWISLCLFFVNFFTILWLLAVIIRFTLKTSY